MADIVERLYETREDEALGRAVAAEREEAHAAGYAIGLEHGREEAAAEFARLRSQLAEAREALEMDRALFARFGKGEGTRHNALHAWTRVGATLERVKEEPK